MRQPAGRFFNHTLASILIGGLLLAGCGSSDHQQSSPATSGAQLTTAQTPKPRLRSGVRLVYRTNPSATAKVTSQSLNRAIRIIHGRLGQLGDSTMADDLPDSRGSMGSLLRWSAPTIAGVCRLATTMQAAQEEGDAQWRAST